MSDHTCIDPDNKSGPPVVVAGCNAQARIMIVAVSYKGYYLMEQARRAII